MSSGALPPAGSSGSELSRILDALPSPLCALDEAGAWCWSNPAAAALLGDESTRAGLARACLPLQAEEAGLIEIQHGGQQLRARRIAAWDESGVLISIEIPQPDDLRGLRHQLRNLLMVLSFLERQLSEDTTLGPLAARASERVRTLVDGLTPR